MITPELIERTKKACEKLAKDMPKKFEIVYSIGKIWLFYFNQYCLLIFNGRQESFEIRGDPKQEFTTSIGRIIWEAYGEYVEIERDLEESAWYVSALQVHPNGVVGFKASFRDGDGGGEVKLKANINDELSTLFEAFCIRVERD